MANEGAANRTITDEQADPGFIAADNRPLCKPAHGLDSFPL
jgi:hypothetical protein